MLCYYLSFFNEKADNHFFLFRFKHKLINKEMTVQVLPSE